MDISDIKDMEKFSAIIINELKAFGVKYSKEKKKKITQNKPFRKTIFCTDLHLLELTDVILANGRVVQIPKFVAEACNRVLEQVETEGIFRKAGSFVRQKEIRINLEAGAALGKSHHVIDIANVIKYFFRELPEPLIPPTIQQTLLRSLLVGDNYVQAILLGCLLLPPLIMNTLSFFMQFLYTVSLSENVNKMSVENLSIIFTPGLMPFSNNRSLRFTNHVKIVRILIENANLIGTIPRSVQKKLQQSSNFITSLIESENHIASSTKNIKKSTSVKKKKRRSDMFKGLRKIVGSAMGSSEYLDYSPKQNRSDLHVSKSVNTIKKKEIDSKVATPNLNENEKRKFGDPTTSTLSTKKEESKKSRLSLGGRRHIKNISFNPVVTSMERRWSIVGSGWSKSKNKNALENNYFKSNNCILNVKTIEDCDVTDDENHKFSETASCSMRQTVDDDSDCIKVSKIQYNEIKERVALIENRISSEFESICDSVLKSPSISEAMNCTELVQTQYNRMVIKTEALSSPGTEHLTKRLSRGLKIRQSIDQCIIRSPSARKIGTMRRRSQEKIRLSRNSSWHIRSSNSDPTYRDLKSPLDFKTTSNHVNSKLFYTKHKIAGQRNNLSNEISLQTSKYSSLKNSLNDTLNNEQSSEQWMSGEEFFSGMHIQEPSYKSNKNCLIETNIHHVTTPVSQTNYFNAEITPMLPPKLLPKKVCNVKTPLKSAIKSSTVTKLPFVNRTTVSTSISEEVSGRASIARLRSQNAGMVMAKAKLFDELGINSSAEKRSLKENRLCYLNCYPKELFKKQNEIMHSSEVKSKCTFEKVPNSKRIQSAHLSSPPSPLNRKHRCNAAKYPQKSKYPIKSIVSDNLNGHPLFWENTENLNSKVDLLRQPNHSRSHKSPKRKKKCVNR